MAEQHLIGWGLLSLRQTVVVQWNEKIPPIDKNDPWCLSFRQTGLDLEPITVAFRVVASRKTCEARVTSPEHKSGHKIVENLVVAHATGSHSRWEVAKRISKAGTVKTFIVTGASGMTLSTVTDHLRGFNCGFLIRVLHFLEGLNHGYTDSPLPQC